MKNILGALFAGTFACTSVAAQSTVVTGDDWARPRTARSIAQFPALQALVKSFDRIPSARIVVRHAKTEEATLWAEELRAWLVSLGIPSAHVRLEADGSDGEQLLLEIQKATPAS
jgi:hypothetical protein